MITPASFRTDLPEFADNTAFPDPVINYWIGIGVLLLVTTSWGLGSDPAVSPPKTVYDFGLEMFVAHNLALEAQAIKTATNGGIPGTGAAGGVVASESVGSVSRSYDTSAGIIMDAGLWNTTIYGRRFYQLARLRGKGPVQIGPPQGPTVGGAWAGPPVGPWGPNGF